jgi:tRNA-dihydrouridine synthase
MYKDITKPFFVLAPMDDVTDTVFRQMVHVLAPADLYMTEFVNVDGLMSVGRQHLMRKLRFVVSEGPLIAQIWGLKPDNFRAVAEQIADGRIARELGLPEGCNFVGVDLNMGCPAKSEVQNGACSALIKPENRMLSKEIIDATKAGLAGRLPLSVKTRLGFNQIDFSWHEFLLQQDIAALTVHGRTRKQMSKVPAEWSNIGHIARLRDALAPHTLVIGNGDVLSRKQGEELAATHNLDGIMIGRGVFHDPYVFAATSPWKYKTPAEKVALFRQHVELFASTWQTDERKIITLNKFCKIYVNDFDGAKEMRETLMAAVSAEDLLNRLAQCALVVQ